MDRSEEGLRCSCPDERRGRSMSDYEAEEGMEEPEGGEAGSDDEAEQERAKLDEADADFQEMDKAAADAMDAATGSSLDLADRDDQAVRGLTGASADVSSPQETGWDSSTSPEPAANDEPTFTVHPADASNSDERPSLSELGARPADSPDTATSGSDQAPPEAAEPSADDLAADDLADRAERPGLTTETEQESQQAPADAQGQRSEALADQQSSERPVAFSDQSSARGEGPGTPQEFTPRQREQLRQYGIDPDGVASAHADRLASALTNADLAWNASRGDVGAADQLRARRVSAKVESGGAPGTESPTESHLVQATDANTSLRIESILDRATGVITRRLRFQSADGYVVNGSGSEQVELAVVRDERVASGPGDQVTPAAGLEQQPRTGERAHQESSDRRDANQVDRPSATYPERETKDRWADGPRAAQVFGRLPEGAQEAAKAGSRGTSEGRGRRSEVSEIADFVRDQFGRSEPERLLGGFVAGVAKAVFEPAGWVRDAAILGYHFGEAFVTGSTAFDFSKFQPSSDLTRSLLDRERAGEEVGSQQAATEFALGAISSPVRIPFEFGRALAEGDPAEIGEQSFNMLLLLATLRAGRGRARTAGPEAPVEKVPAAASKIEDGAAAAARAEGVGTEPQEGAQPAPGPLAGMKPELADRIDAISDHPGAEALMDRLDKIDPAASDAAQRLAALERDVSVAEEAIRPGRSEVVESGEEETEPSEPGRMRELLTREPPKWTRKQLNRLLGQEFEAAQRGVYEAEQLRLENGKVLDGYTEGDVIVSRKRTQLWEVTPETAEEYINEFLDKYGPGNLVSDDPYNVTHYPHLVGTRLRGQMILEVPVQEHPVPEGLWRWAERWGILIRDDTGHVYNPD
jgi:hypothetical protein